MRLGSPYASWPARRQQALVGQLWGLMELMPVVLPAVRRLCSCEMDLLAARTASVRFSPQHPEIAARLGQEYTGRRLRWARKLRERLWLGYGPLARGGLHSAPNGLKTGPKSPAML